MGHHSGLPDLKLIHPRCVRSCQAMESAGFPVSTLIVIAWSFFLPLPPHTIWYAVRIERHNGVTIEVQNLREFVHFRRRQSYQGSCTCTCRRPYQGSCICRTNMCHSYQESCTCTVNVCPPDSPLHLSTASSCLSNHGSTAGTCYSCVSPVSHRSGLLAIDLIDRAC